MSVINNQRLAAKICEMYYLRDMSQKEISSRLKISRPHICRIIAQARENGMVEIHIKNPHREETTLEHQLLTRFFLEDAMVIDAAGADKAERDAQFGREAAAYLDTFLSNGTQLGVMSGKTVSTIARYMKNDGKHLGLVVPLVGGIGTASSDLHANSIAMQIAAKYGGTSLVLNAPLVVSNAETAAILKQEATIAQVLEAGRHCDAAIIGIGNVDEHSTTAQAGGISEEDLHALREAGAVCSVCNSYYDADGKEVDILSNKSIGVELKDLKKGRIIACALGKSKTQAIHAALMTKRISVLITDADTARCLLTME
ncbi:MAG: sugar-binding transcriptional regulator [Clostridia bacterium]|nr:sugar-binding transcriptional regulator [Clostridia bacterium]